MVEMNSSREHQCVQIKFMQVFGLKPPAIRAHLLRAHGGHALSVPTVYQWCKKFQSGKDDIKDDKRSGRPTKLTPEMLGNIQLILEQDKTMSLCEISLRAGLSVGTIHHALKDKLHLSKRPACWVAHHLSADQKACRKRISEELNDKLLDDFFLPCLVTCDES